MQGQHGKVNSELMLNHQRVVLKTYWVDGLYRVPTWLQCNQGLPSVLSESQAVPVEGSLPNVQVGDNIVEQLLVVGEIVQQFH